MQKPNFLSRCLVVPLGLGAIAFLTPIAQAQQTAPYQGENNVQQSSPYQSNEQDPMKSMMGGALNPLQLMHNAQTGLSRDGQSFADDTSQGLSKAAADFKKKQQQLLQQQSGQITQSGNGNPSKSP